MTRYLLAAEADKIQDFLFRSSKLREVVGGSQLLTRFCHEAATALIKKRSLPVKDIVTADGGGFRILFDEVEQAEAFGRDLAEVYRMAVDGSLTVAEPVKYDGNFQAASQAADEKLRLAKQTRPGGEALAHFPYVAVCASCGMALAQGYKPLRESHSLSAKNPGNYVCYACRIKRAEREAGGDFLKKFEEAVRRASSSSRELGWIDEPEELARFDPRHYVAYLKADGNYMGRLFGQCRSPEQMTQLSKTLSDTIRASLAEPVAKIMEQRQDPETQGLLPALPLILGGDDVFILLPAPWALDFAGRFCRLYETEMSQALEKIPLQPTQPPTLTAAVVICKSSYPYRLAHYRAEALLEEAKRLSKVAALDGGGTRSMIHFEVIRGNRLVEAEAGNGYRSGLSPYWAQASSLASAALDRAISLAGMIEGRYALRNLPARRRAHLRELFDPSQLPKTIEDLAGWNRRLDALLDRVGREVGNRADLERSLEALGQAKVEPEGYWRQVARIGQVFKGHGLPDLLDAWDFAYSLDKPRDEYEQEAI